MLHRTSRDCGSGQVRVQVRPVPYTVCSSRQGVSMKHIYLSYYAEMQKNERMRDFQTVLACGLKSRRRAGPFHRAIECLASSPRHNSQAPQAT